MAMKAHKFLATGARGPLSGFAWPTPRGDSKGTWVEAEGALLQCSRGVHVCRPLDLAHWIHDELWEVETSGDEVDGLDCIVVRRARLVRRMDAWGVNGRQRFASACVEHAAAQVTETVADGVRQLLDDARFMATNGYVTISAYTAALAVGRIVSQEPSAYRREREWQSAWIASELLATHMPTR